MPWIERRHAESESDGAREDYEGFMREAPCPACAGARLRLEVLAVTVQGRSIAEVAALSIGEAAQWVQALELTQRERLIGERVLREIQARLGFLADVGLDYLSLDRAAATLAGGEAQRIRLATQIGSGLAGRAVRTGRAIGWPAPAGQPPADRDAAAAARPGQHADRRGARRGHHRVRGLGRGHRPAGRASTGARSWSAARSATWNSRRSRSPARTCRGGGGSRYPRGGGPGGRDTSWSSKERASTTCATSTSRSRWAPSSRSRESPGQASHRWSATSCTRRWRTGSTERRCRRAGTRGSRASSRSTRWPASTSPRSGARHGRTRRPIPACSITSASCSHRRPRRGSAATSRAGSRSTSRAGAARTARATARSGSR